MRSTIQHKRIQVHATEAARTLPTCSRIAMTPTQLRTLLEGSAVGGYGGVHPGVWRTGAWRPEGASPRAPPVHVCNMCDPWRGMPGALLGVSSCCAYVVAGRGALSVAVPALLTHSACRYGVPGLAFGAGALGVCCAGGSLACSCVFCVLFCYCVLLLTMCIVCSYCFVLWCWLPVASVS